MAFFAEISAFVYQKFLKPIFFLVDPTVTHEYALIAGRIINRSVILQKIVQIFCIYKNNKLEQKILGLTFLNPVGLSAGFDKDAELINLWPSVGFGFSEVGSITLNPYPGNPAPQAYRLIKSGGLVINYGLKNQGIKKIMPRLSASYPAHIPLNISIAKTNCQATADESYGINDYIDTLKQINSQKVGDIYTLNISCPNTFGGEPFTTPSALDRLLTQVADLHITKPIFLKMPIDLPWEEFRQLLDIAVKHHIQGVTIGNLTKQRHNLKDNLPDHIPGGISGLPTQSLSNDLISRTYQQYGQQLIIIGVGGIFSADDAYEKIKRGASLVELITGMIFQGPQLIGQINAGLARKLQADGYSRLSEAIGAYHR